MPSPNRSDVHVNRPLTNMSIAYIQNAKNFIADRVFPNVPVKKQSDTYFQYSKEDFFRDEMRERAPATESAGGGWDVDNTPSYRCKKWALHKDVDEETRANYDDPLNADRDATIYLTGKGLLRKERLWVNGYFKAGIWGRNVAGVAGAPVANQFKQWDQAGSTPILDVQRESIQMAERTGYRPNKLVIGPYVHLTLSNHPEILERIKYTQKGFISLDLLAAAFGVDEVLVPFGTENKAAKGAVGDYAFFFGKAALLVYAAPAASLYQPSGGYIFPWTGLLGGGAFGTHIAKWWEQKIKSDRVEIEMAFDMKLVCPDVGTYFDTAIA